MKPWMKTILDYAKKALANPAVQQAILQLVSRVLFGSPARAMASDHRCKISDPEWIRREVQRLNLKRSARFDCLAKEDWAKVWNGWGPDSWPYVLRAVITWMERYLEVVAGPHDEWYDQSDGTPETWRIVMDQWTSNTHLALNDKFPMSAWYLWPMRAATWVKAKAAIALLEKWSFSAWVSAFKRGESI